MQFKKNRAILAAVLAAAMSSSTLMSIGASAAGTNKYGDDTYAKRFMSLYEDVIVNGEEKLPCCAVILAVPQQDQPGRRRLRHSVSFRRRADLRSS